MHFPNGNRTESKNRKKKKKKAGRCTRCDETNAQSLHLFCSCNTKCKNLETSLASRCPFRFENHKLACRLWKACSFTCRYATCKIHVVANAGSQNKADASFPPDAAMQPAVSLLAFGQTSRDMCWLMGGGRTTMINHSMCCTHLLCYATLCQVVVHEKQVIDISKSPWLVCDHKST